MGIRKLGKTDKYKKQKQNKTIEAVMRHELIYNGKEVTLMGRCLGCGGEGERDEKVARALSRKWLRRRT